MPYRVISPVADIHAVPDKSSLRGKFETQLVFGESFIVEEEKNGWSRGICAHDSYPGWIESIHLTPSSSRATHIVTTARSHLYRDATIKSPALGTLSFGSRITITSTQEKFAQMDDSAWIYKQHLSPIDTLDKDHVATAMKFLETPYYWGGRSGFGIDCSGLLQVCLARAGIAVPRDTEDQISAVGHSADTAKTGDIIFFPGHTGIMIDNARILHANGFHMKTTIEPLTLMTERSGGITAIRRL